MLELERLKRRNRESLLLETIKQVGASNYSLVARLTGLNAETVRYKVSKQITKFGLKISPNINYAQLGFSLGLLTVKSGPSTGRSWLDHSSYLTVVSKVSGADKYVCVYGVPQRFKSRYLQTIEVLKDKGLVEDYSSVELEWLRYPSFRSEYYDFEKKTWNADWKKVGVGEHEEGVLIAEAEEGAHVDEVDLKILKRLSDDPTVGLTKIAAEVGVNPRTLRYHHAEHVVKTNLILGNRIRWVAPVVEQRANEVMQIMVTFKGLSQGESEPVRRLFNRLPFTWLEAGSSQHDYFALLDVPILSYYELVAFVEGRVQSVRDRFEMTILDPTKTQYDSIPDELFDTQYGWRLFGLPEEGDSSR